ncbi:MAG: amino acid ABC transporter permease [Dehalococcoidia bacterium]
MAIQQTTSVSNITKGAYSWAQENLFGSPINIMISLLIFPLSVYLFVSSIDWILNKAEWGAVTSNIRIFLVGQYPQSELWRIGTVASITTILLGISWHLKGLVFRRLSLIILVPLLTLVLMPPIFLDISAILRSWLTLVSSGFIIGYYISRFWSISSKNLLIAWLVSMVVDFILLRGIEGVGILPYVSTNEWGGLLLTFFLAIIGIFLSFPLGIFLALGRRSKLPFLKGACVIFIESIRAVPLVTLLFMTLIIVPLLLPEGWRLDRVGRAIAAITIFSGAYMAENVRGGLASVPIGQTEAAKALGLGPLLTTTLIVLPQALRNVIPAIVGQFISLFKDTSLVVIVGLLDLVGIGKAVVLGNVEYIDQQAEVYLFIAAVYWVFTFSMSHVSQILEQSLGVGDR